MNEEQSLKTIQAYTRSQNDNMALLFTAPWGIGKSHFLQQCQQEITEKMIFISLCGITSVQELSQCVYEAVRFFNKSQTEKEIAKFSKPFISGVAALTPFKDAYHPLQEMLSGYYSSANFAKHLIVFEDVERSEISINALLGYIKNLMETQHAKVLIVAHQNKINNEDVYHAIKEKVIGQTIYFTPNQLQAMQDIVATTDCITLPQDWTTELYEKAPKPINLRTFIAALQEYKMFLQLCQSNDIQFENDELKSIYISICMFRVHYAHDSMPEWKSQKLWQHQIDTLYCPYPIFNFVYIYCAAQELDFHTIKYVLQQWRQTKKGAAEALQATQALVDLRKSLTAPNETVRKYFDNMLIELQRNTVAFQHYSEILEFLLLFKDALDLDINPYVQAMITNVRGKHKQKEWITAFPPHLSFARDIDIEQYKTIKNSLYQSAQQELPQPAPAICTEELLSFELEFNETPISRYDISNVCNSITQWDATTFEALRLRIIREHEHPELSLTLQDTMWLQALSEALSSQISGDYTRQLQHKWLHETVKELLKCAHTKYRNIASSTEGEN